MKKIVVCLLLSLSLSYLYSSDTVSLITTLDTTVVDALWRKHVALTASAEIRSSMGLGLKTPITVVIDRSGGSEALIETSLKLVTLPWTKGPFISLTLAHVAFFIGQTAPEERLHFLSEVEFGYSWEFLPSWFVEPSLVYRDPSHSYPDSFSYINSFIPTYSRLRLSLAIGYRCLSFSRHT
ncbi:MAG: hypothetical protein ACOX0W_05665 [Sphaerochaetaceae bacterium]